jgi:hypothetical protein
MLRLDPENSAAHYNLALIADQPDDPEAAAEHRRPHEMHRPDDNARDRAITIERRRNPAADHAARALVIHPLQRVGAFGLPAAARPAAGPLLTDRE